RVERALPRFPREQVLPPLVWPWMAQTAAQADLTALLLGALGTRPPERLIPYLPQMDPWRRAQLAGLLADAQPFTGPPRVTLLGLAGDASGYVREKVFAALAKVRLTEAEAAQVEPLLRRKRADLREAVLRLLVGQNDAGALASAGRLLGQRAALPRQAGL